MNNPEQFSEDIFQYHQKVGVPQKFVVLNSGGTPVLFLKQKFLALRVHIEVYKDEQYTSLVMVVRKRHLIELFPTYDILDSQGNLLGRICRKFAAFQHKWSILDGNGELIGEVHQDVTAAAVESATLTTQIGGFNVGGMVQNFSPFQITYKGQRIGTFYRKLALPFLQYEMNLHGDPQKAFNRRLALGLAVVLDRGENR